MANDLNLCQFIGRLGRDPEIRFSPDGKAMATLSLACGQSWKSKDTGEKQEKTEWVRIVSFGKLAETIGEYMRKGSQMYISGRIQTRKYQDKDGADKYVTEIVANEMQMLGGRRDGAEGGGEQGSPPISDKPSASAEAYRKASGGAAKGGNEFDDDIPF